MEALACEEIFTRAERGEIQLVWSFMHEDETILCPFPERKYEVSRLAALCQVRVGPKEEIYNYAKLLEQKEGLSAKDAVHLSCARFVRAEFFLTCDDKLAKQAKQVSLEMDILNPVDCIRRWL